MNKKEQAKQKGMTEFSIPKEKEVVSIIKGNESTEVEKYFEDVKVTDIEKNAFLESILFNTPFTHTIELFDGKIKVEFKTLLEEERLELLRDENLQKVKAGVLVGPEEMILVAKKELMLMLNSVEFTGQKIILTSYPLDARMDMLKSKIPEQLLDIVFQQVDKFNRLVSYLSYKADCPDFWKIGTDH